VHAGAIKGSRRTAAHPDVRAAQPARKRRGLRNRRGVRIENA